MSLRLREVRSGPAGSANTGRNHAGALLLLHAERAVGVELDVGVEEGDLGFAAQQLHGVVSLAGTRAGAAAFNFSHSG